MRQSKRQPFAIVRNLGKFAGKVAASAKNHKEVLVTETHCTYHEQTIRSNNALEEYKAKRIAEYKAFRRANRQ